MERHPPSKDKKEKGTTGRGAATPKLSERRNQHKGGQKREIVPRPGESGGRPVGAL